MKTLLLLYLLFFSITFLCFHKKATANKPISIVPKPTQLLEKEGTFKFNEHTSIYLGDFTSLKNRFQEEIKSETNLQLKVVEKKTKSHCIELRKVKGLSNEEYQLSVTSKRIIVKSSAEAGAYYALQSIKHLLNTSTNNNQNILIKNVEISDKPAFGYRGMMLDHSRHFQTIDELKDLLDQMAYLKLNRFHMHLSDDQGFRLEIESYPQLNSIGSYRVDRNTTDENINNVWGRLEQKEGEIATYGGYYKKEEIRDLIRYAKERHIEILPEIDVPGHARAIIASYPEISCTEGPIYVAPGWSKANNTICPSNEKSYEIMDAIFKEVAELFTYEYIHVGGDECYRHYWDAHDECVNFMHKHNMKDNAELQSYFIKRMEKIVNKYGKKMIGWDEILDGGLAKNATVMSWRGEVGGIKSAKMGHDVIMSPSTYQYIDLKQGQADFEPNIGYGFLPLHKTYRYKVIPDALTKEQAKHILGTQTNLWTENLDSWDKITYMTYPRLFAVAENAWTEYDNKNWEDFVNRLESQMQRLDKKGIRHAKSVYRPWLHHKGGKGEIKVWFTSQIPNCEIRYTLDGSTPNSNSPLANDSIVLDKTSTITAGTFINGKLMKPAVSKKFLVHKAANCKIVMNGKEIENSKLTDLSYGQLLEVGDQNWVRTDKDFWIEIKFQNKTNVDAVVVRSLRHTLRRWYAADRIQVFTKENGLYTKIGDSGYMAENTTQGRNVFENKVPCEATGIISIFVKVLGCGEIPVEHVNQGQNKLLSIDEIIVL